MASFPNVREAPRCECDVPLLRDILQEYAGTWKDGLCAADSPEDANTLSPDVEVHIWSLESLREGSAGPSDCHQVCPPDRGYRRELKRRRLGATSWHSCPPETPAPWREYLGTP